MTKENQQSNQIRSLPANPSVKVVGVGSAGAAMVGRLAQAGFENVSYSALAANARAFDAAGLAEKCLIGAKATRGLGVGGDPRLGRVTAEGDIEAVRSVCGGADIVFLVAGLGGGTGSGAAPVAARIAREQGALVVAMVSLPFDFEGSRRRRQASEALEQLRAEADCVLCLPNQRLLRMIDGGALCLETFKLTHQLMAEGFTGIVRLLTQPGMIKVDFADLCAITNGRNLETLFASVGESGEGRAQKVLEKLLSHPLLDEGRALLGAQNLLVCIQGGPDLTMVEVDQVMAGISLQCASAEVTFGAVIDPRESGRLVVTLVSASPASSPFRDTGGAGGRLEAQSPTIESDTASELFDNSPPVRPPSRFVPPPPSLTHEEKEKHFQRRGGGNRKKMFGGAKQAELQLETVSKGRFEKSEPTIHQGEDLDVPTYVRRGMALN